MPKRESINLHKKYEIIQLLKQKAKKSEIVKKYKLKSESNVHRIWNNRHNIISTYEGGNQSTKRTKLQNGKFPQIESALIQFMTNVHKDTDITIDGLLLKEKALEYAEKAQIKGFNASDGWLANLKRRHGIKFGTIHGEAKSVDNNVVQEWTSEKLSEIIKNYKSDDIFKEDEFGLFFKCLPNRKMHLKGESCSGGKQSKERVTVFIACNMSGNEKLKLTLIGKSAKPRCFKGFKNTRVNYFHNKTAWMTEEIFTKILSYFNDKMVMQKRNVLFFVDNCPSHPQKLKFSNVKLVFLPKNTTARLQPCDAGVISWVKRNYRSKIVRKLLASYENNESLIITLKDALIMIHSSWKELSSDTIKNCFKKCGFENDNIEITEIESSELNESCNQLSSKLRFKDISFNDYASMDDNLAICQKLNEKSIIDELTNREDV